MMKFVKNSAIAAGLLSLASSFTPAAEAAPFSACALPVTGAKVPDNYKRGVTTKVVDTINTTLLGNVDTMGETLEIKYPNKVQAEWMAEVLDVRSGTGKKGAKALTNQTALMETLTGAYNQLIQTMYTDPDTFQMAMDIIDPVITYDGNITITGVRSGPDKKHGFKEPVVLALNCGGNSNLTASAGPVAPAPGG